jgi:hypothetical protein
MKFSNWKIVSKVIALLLMLGAVSVFAALFGGSKISEVDETYTKIADQSYPGLLALARANRFISGVALGAFSAISFDDDEGTKFAITVFDNAVKNYQAGISTAKSRDPERAAIYDDVDKDFAPILANLGKSKSLAPRTKTRKR